MSEKVISLSNPLVVQGASIVSFQVREDGLSAVTADGDAVSVDPAVLTALSGQLIGGGSAEERAEQVTAALAAIPVSWAAQGDTLAMTMLDGNTRTVPAAPFAQMLGVEDAETAAAILNAGAGREAGEPRLEGGDSITVGALAGALAKGLAGKLGGAVGGMIIDALFPSRSIQSYFDEMYQKIAKMVHQEIVANQIDIINGKINGTKGFMCNTYSVRKKSGAPKSELFQMVRPYVDEFYYNVTYTLQTSNYRKPGLSVFLLGASMHLSLLQEQALVDPSAPEPRKSSYATSVSRQVADYLAMARDTWTAIITARQARLEKKVSTFTNPYTHDTVFLSGKIVDNETGQTIYETNNVVEWVVYSDGRMTQAKTDIYYDLSCGLAGDDGIDALFANWEGLKTNPIPKT